MARGAYGDQLIEEQAKGERKVARHAATKDDHGGGDQHDLRVYRTLQRQSAQMEKSEAVR